MEFDTRTKKDGLAELKKKVEETQKPIIMSREELRHLKGDPFDWRGIRDKLDEDQMARKTLAYFLLPYCDMPTTDGHKYVLPEEMVNDHNCI